MGENGKISKVILFCYNPSPRNSFLDKRSFFTPNARRSSSTLAQNVTQVQLATSDRHVGRYVPSPKPFSYREPWKGIWNPLPDRATL